MTGRRWFAPILFLAVTLLGASCSSRVPQRSSAVEDSRGNTTQEARTDDLVQIADGNPSGSHPGAGDGSSSSNLPGTRGALRTGRSTAGVGTGSSTDSESFESPPPVTYEAGPPVFYTDQADDAYGPDTSPNAALSQPGFDILRVDWGPTSFGNQPGGYSISITIAGAARGDAWYIPFGHRPGCTLYHILAPGITAFANAYCSGEFTGRVPGTRVTSTPTPDGGTILSATFDNRAMPPPWNSASGSGRTLQNLSAMTCMHRSPSGSFDCSPYDVLDRADSTLGYRV
jgi:hypothetical protein